MRTLPLVGAIAGALLAACTTGEPGAPPDAGPPTVHTQQSTVATPVESERPTVTIAAVGDILMGTAPNRLPPNGGRGFFDRLAEPLRADLTMGTSRRR